MNVKYYYATNTITNVTTVISKPDENDWLSHVIIHSGALCYQGKTEIKTCLSCEHRLYNLLLGNCTELFLEH